MTTSIYDQTVAFTADKNFLFNKLCKVLDTDEPLTYARERYAKAIIKAMTQEELFNTIRSDIKVANYIYSRTALTIE